MKSTNIIITIIVLIFIAGGVYTLVNKNTDEIMKDVSVTESDKMIQSNNVMMEDKITSTTSDSMMETDIITKAGTYEVYSPEKIAISAEKGNTVLFFKASWCPSCRTVDTDIKANLSNIPSNLTILDVDYDKSSDLKKKYGVTYQHTFVQVDKDGNMIKKWSGGSTLASVISEVK